MLKLSPKTLTALNILLALAATALIAVTAINLTKTDPANTLAIVAILLALLSWLLDRVGMNVGDFFKSKTCTAISAAAIVVLLPVTIIFPRKTPSIAASPDSRSNAPRHDRPIASQTAPSHAISILSTPSGAAITIDGKFYGLTPRTAIVKKGSHTIMLSKDGFREYRDIVEAPKQSILSIELETR